MTVSSELLFFIERGSGPPLLLVHGLMITGAMFDPVVEHFAQRHRVIVPDLRGHGRSRELGPPYTAAQLAADLARLLDHLHVRRAAVLGYSQGGAIAQQLAIDHPSRCERLILGCTYAHNMATFREKVEGRIGPWFIRTFGLRRFASFGVSQSSMKADAARYQWLVDVMATQNLGLMLRAWNETMAFDSRRRLGEISCPTLIVAGAEDQAVPLHHAKQLNAGIRGSQLVVIDGADHALIWTRTDDFVRVVDTFLAAGE